MKKIIITGTSSWLWKELSKVFLEKWYEVIGISRNNPHGEKKYISTDFTDERSISQAIDIIKEKYSDFSCIICCAWIWYIEKLDNIDFKHTEEMFRVNLLGQNYLLSWLSSLIKENNADLVFIGATIWYKWNEFMPMYSMTKWAIRGLIENWRNELKSKKSRVIGIHPWWLNTNSNIWENWRETIISHMTWKEIWSLLDVNSLAHLILNFFELPENMEVSEIIINRK